MLSVPMYLIKGLLFFCLLAPGLFATAPRPCVLQYNVNDQLLPVVGFEKRRPVVFDGKTTHRYRDETRYALGRADRYAPGYIEFASTVGEQVYGTGFDATLVSSEDLKGAFIAFLVFDQGFLTIKEANYPESQIAVFSLPELPKDKPVKVTFSSGSSFWPNYLSRRELETQNPGKIIPGGGARLYAPIIFAPGGFEVRSNRWERISQYFHKIDVIKQTEATILYRQRFPKESHAAVPFITVPPIFPRGTPLPRETVKAVLTLDATGAVTDVALDGQLDASVTTALDDALGDWLFLPALEAGAPTAIKVQVPLKF